ncbi:MAG TPA: pyridoxamine 5'-phosphate oxidase family protein [Streptosporangiaceae bacterium]|nr:pyridoxamine 5'-phosphate oxidase family protein [Streptosporangiaceae bacterium]
MDILPLSAELVVEPATENSASARNEGRGRQVRWQELTRSECFRLLAQEQVGRVAVIDDRGPVMFPVNFVFDRHMVVFRTDEGTKLDAAARCGQVAFEIDGIDAAAHTGWSVVVRGEAVEVTDQQELARLRKLPLFPWAPGARGRYVRILPAKLTGRRISRPGGPSARGGGPPPEAAARGRR